MKRFEYLGRQYTLTQIGRRSALAFEVLSYNVLRDALRVRLTTGQILTIALSLFERCRRAGTVLDS